MPRIPPEGVQWFKGIALPFWTLRVWALPSTYTALDFILQLPTSEQIFYTEHVERCPQLAETKCVIPGCAIKNMFCRSLKGQPE